VFPLVVDATEETKHLRARLNEKVEDNGRNSSSTHRRRLVRIEGLTGSPPASAFPLQECQGNFVFVVKL
jgi:hypothetical protein